MIDPKFKDVKVGDWTFTIAFGWEKASVSRDPLGHVYVTCVKTFSYTAEGFRDATDKYPSAWTYNPFDPTGKPPCEFKEGEVIAVSNTKQAWAYGKNNEMFRGLYIVDGREWKYACKLTPEEKGE